METPNAIKKVLIIGPGPETIGQGSELSNAVAGACRVFRAAAIKTVVVDSNLASPATDLVSVERAYIEPLNLATVEHIIARENPDAMLPIFGGRMAFDLMDGLAERGLLERYRLQTLGITPEAVRRSERLIEIRQLLTDEALKIPIGGVAGSVKDGLDISAKIGFPVVVRPLAAVSGTEAGLVYNREEFVEIMERTLDCSPLQQVLVEESLEGWREYEWVVVRDRTGAFLVVATVECMEPVGVHIGDSIKILPAQSLTGAEINWVTGICRNIMEQLALVGGAGLRFAFNPAVRQWALININPRYTAISALAAKVSGIDLAEIWTKLVLGERLTELFEPAVLEAATVLGLTNPYTAVAVPRFDFEKFATSHRTLSITMKSVGETLAMGRNFKEALQKAARAAGRTFFEWPDDSGRRLDPTVRDAEIKLNLINLNPELLYFIRLALRRGRKPAEIAGLSRIAPEIVEQLAALVALEKELTTYALYNLPVAVLRKAKEAGFSDRCLARLLAVSETQVRDARNAGGVRVNYFPVRPSGSEMQVKTWAATYHRLEQSVMDPEAGLKVLLLGVDPRKTGTGLESAVVEAARTLREMGYQPVLVDSGTGALGGSKDVFAGVYVEPVAGETIANLLETERFAKVITDFSGGGDSGWLNSPVLTDIVSPALSYITDSVRLQQLLERVGLKPAEASDLKADTGLAVEVIGDGTDALVTGTVEQIEEARINLEDSACSLPPYSLDREVAKQVETFAVELARELKLQGLMRVRFAVGKTRIGFVEMNWGAGALTSFIAKATGTAWVDVATKAIMGVGLRTQILPEVAELTHTAVREAVFPFKHFPDLDPVLGRETRSTGAVMGIAQDFGMAFLKSQLAAGEKVPTSGIVYLSIRPTDWRNFAPLAQQLVELGFDLAAEEETTAYLNRQNIFCLTVKQIGAGRPDILDWIKNGKVRWIISTPTEAADYRNEAVIRSTAVAKGIPITTTFSAARAAVRGMRQYSAVGQVAKALQDYSFFTVRLNMRKG